MKTWLAILGLTVSGSVFADGFYVGAQGGLSKLNAETPTGVDLGTKDMVLGVFAGYQYDYNSLFIAGEFDSTWGKLENKKEINGLKYEAQLDNSYGIHALAGMRITDDMDVYGRLGLNRTKLAAREYLVVGGEPTTVSKEGLGLVYGGGARYHFDDMLAVRFDYRYIKYKNFTPSEGGAGFKVGSHIFSVGMQHTF